MKRLMILAMLFAFLGVQQSSAQKWAKKLGKVAGAILSDNKKPSSKDAPIPGFSIKYSGCTISGNDAVINAVMTNNTGKEVELWFPGYDVGTAFDDNNAQHTVSLKIGDTQINTGNYRKKMPAGVPVKAVITIEKISRDNQQIKGCNINGSIGHDDKFVWSVPTQQVVLTKNTNADNVVSSNPTVTFNLRKCVRQGNNVVISATVTNTSGKDLRFFTRESNSTIYDADGESYHLDMDASKFAQKYWGEGQDITIPSGVPIKATFVIKDVAGSVTQLSIAKLVYSVWPTSTVHYFEIRNQAIAEQ